jgi:hypothetical protein
VAAGVSVAQTANFGKEPTVRGTGALDLLRDGSLQSTLDHRAKLRRTQFAERADSVDSGLVHGNSRPSGVAA